MDSRISILIVDDERPLCETLKDLLEVRGHRVDFRNTAREALEAAVRDWSRSFAASDLHSYFRLYAEDFSYRGMSRDEWMAYRLANTARRVLDDLLIEELVLLADPEEDGLYVSRFRQTLVRGEQRLTTMKRLYWRRLESGAFEIVAEDNG